MLLPTSRAAVVTFFALQARAHRFAHLGWPRGGRGRVRGAARISVVITARAFVERAKLQALVSALEPHVTILYLEDLRLAIGTPAAPRRGAALDAAPPAAPASARPDPAVVLFTSGSEGPPKGVVLSHRNLLANRHQLAAVIDISPRDGRLNALPIFHSFELTGGVLRRCVSGSLRSSILRRSTTARSPSCRMGSTPRCCSAPTPSSAGYARVADADDFYAVRYVFAGAERVKPETRDTWFEKFGIRIMEGYGATETAPVLAVNTPMHYRAGTVGRLLPGIEHRIERVEGIAEGGRLFVRGPNVMLGYLRVERPGVLEPPPGGWYDTGDIVDIDAAGFVTIKGRAKRFAKIAGEMVSLGAVEQLVATVWPRATHAVVAIPDRARGEQLVLVTDQADATRAAMVAAARTAGLPELLVPRRLTHVTQVPTLARARPTRRVGGWLSAAEDNPATGIVT
jgi:acyl-[acyl-carrier-protein]-phospholipid O-acyltransferase/long-chain-fatty-acid--[acyl-carrier-protein] ligase